MAKCRTRWAAQGSAAWLDSHPHLPVRLSASRSLSLGTMCLWGLEQIAECGGQRLGPHTAATHCPTSKLGFGGSQRKVGHSTVDLLGFL